MKTEETKSQQELNPKILYTNQQHMREVLKEITTLHKDDGYENFEAISLYIREKNTKLNFQFKTEEEKIPRCFQLTPTEEKVLNTHAAQKFKSAPIIQNYMEDIISQSKLFEWAGVSFSNTEWYKIRMAAKKLLLDNNCEHIRFWGKIYGNEEDYYVIQGILKAYPMKNPPVHEEARGNEGVNKYTFWVSNSILESWYELPDITHEHLIASKRFKYYFTGNLNSKVKGFRPFPGKEMHLLKCQIIRIMHSSNIVPKGYLKISENFKDQLEGKISEFDEEFKSPSFEEMKSPEGENWVHEYAYIYPNGKVIDPTVEAQVDRMRGINEDEGYKIKEGEGDNINEIDMKYWRVKVVGDQMIHNRANGDPITHALVIVKNNKWPGTLCVWKEEKFANIYVGFGVKATDSPFTPTQHGKVDKDPVDVNEHPEPNPDKEPLPPEEEKKEGAEGEEANNQQEDEDQ